MVGETEISTRCTLTRVVRVRKCASVTASTLTITIGDSDQTCRHDRTRIRPHTRREAREPGGR